jgi:hypothetical protein
MYRRRVARDSHQAKRARANLAEFVATHGGVAFAGVPVSGPELGWPSGAPEHLADAVWFDTGSSGDVITWSDSVKFDFSALLASRPATLVSPRGYADRTVFGMLIACRDLLSRAYPNHELLRAVALMDTTEKMRGRSIVYLAEGIPVIGTDGTAREPRGGNPAPPSWGERVTPSGEDLLIGRYYNERLKGTGTLWQEVPVSDAALDGLYIRALEGTLGWWSRRDTQDLAKTIGKFDVGVVEAKLEMNTHVIGQSVAGAVGLAHAHPRHRLITQTVVVGGLPDPCLDWVCAKRGIAVVRFAD